jgi:ketosteroid isomerase-like protein
VNANADPLSVVRRAIEARDRGDTRALRDVFAPDHGDHRHWHAPLPLPGNDGQPLLDRYEQVYAQTRADFPDARTAIHEQFACGDWVVTAWTVRARHARSGRRIEQRGINVDRVAHGKIAETWVSFDRLGVFQQLGVIAATRGLADRAGVILPDEELQ